MRPLHPAAWHRRRRPALSLGVALVAPSSRSRSATFIIAVLEQATEIPDASAGLPRGGGRRRVDRGTVPAVITASPRSSSTTCSSRSLVSRWRSPTRASWLNLVLVLIVALAVDASPRSVVSVPPRPTGARSRRPACSRSAGCWPLPTAPKRSPVRSSTDSPAKPDSTVSGSSSRAPLGERIAGRHGEGPHPTARRS